MIRELLKPLEWDWDCEDSLTAVCKTKSLSHEYTVRLINGVFYVDYRKFDVDDNDRKDEPPEFDTCIEAQQWVEGIHYPSKMAKWLNTDPLTECAAKFTQWAKDRKIIQNGNLQTQTLKLVSEVGELADNIAKGRDTKDDIGDSFVVLNNLVEMQGYTWQECLEQAWNDIKDRKGYTNEHGVFIKQGDE